MTVAEEFISKKVINIKKVLDSKVKQNEFQLNKVKIEYETYVKSTTEYYQQRLDLRHELSKLFDEQDKAAAREDYEMAEEMNNKIDDLRDQLSITAVTHRHHQDNQQTTSILNKYIDAYEEEINAYKIAVEELVDIETEEKVFIEERQKQLNDELHQIKHFIEAKEDRLKRLRSRVVLDRQHIENEENLLKAEVENKTQVYSSRINVLTLELSDIRKEIVNLEKLLEEAHLKEVEHVLAIEKEQKNIDIVKKELSLEWSDLSEEKLKIKCREDQLEDEEKKLQLYQREYDTKMEGLGQAGFRADSAFGCISALISESKTDLDKKNLELEKFKTFRKKWPCNTSQVAQTLRKELQELTNNVAKLTTEVTNKEAMIATLKKRSAEIQDKCSELQTAKKLAADRRNFREAKKLANELKALNEEHQNYKLQLQAVEVDLESHSADLVQAQTLLSNRQKEVNSIEMKECSSLLVIIVDSIKKLKSQLEILSSEDLLRTVIQQELTVYMMIKNELDSLVPKLNVGESALKIDLAESCNPEEIKYKMKKLESQLESAVVEEDYDLADILRCFTRMML
ncbi:uncharacterized protein TRIADDRAFT_61375 [Trichoplax adhaerens]|uniref:Uncharacterized protein n=1 Tax=Trichoplax adhaerens TaxID=10228 RepID=B3SAT7_TRIAD|nr:hypothetical protein TRIADDRAFT_61375 [Trichoplax adhaerens]EDV20163.1 hypothetical protein TRIADDRAFT_61375 [Trichoplax adhaerens]|eukprot:XP_002117324.1 hypothetical protein TRIADDRAFT_61375 [Trichoplax adhaerens]